MSADPAAASAVLSDLPDDASVWFCFGGDPDDPGLVLGDRAEDPKGKAFLPEAKALAKLGAVAQGVGTRKGGGPLSLVSRNAYAGLVGKLAAWAATHIGEHRGLLLLKDTRFTQVDKSNTVLDQQTEPLAWDALDAAVAEADAEPAREPDDLTEMTLMTLQSGAESCWFWITRPLDDGEPARLLLLDRSTDPKGAALSATMKAGIDDGLPNPGSARGIATFKPGRPPTFVARAAYDGFLAAIVDWYRAWGHCEGAEAIKGAGYTQVNKSNEVVDEQVDPGAWAELDAEQAAAAGEPVVEITEASRSADAVSAVQGEDQLWFYVARQGDQVAAVLRHAEHDPGRSDFDRGVLKAREAFGEDGASDREESVGRARLLPDGTFRFQSLEPFKAFTAALQTWVTAEAGDAPGLGRLVGSRFQYVSEAGMVFTEQTWPSGSRSERSRRVHSRPEQEQEAAPAPAPRGPKLPESETLAATRRALDGTRVDLEPARQAFRDAAEDARDLDPRKLQDLGHEVEALSGLVEAWLEQRADYEDARAQTRALRRAAWGAAPAGGQVLPELPHDPADAAEDARDLAGACIDTEEDAKAWVKAAQGPPLTARNPFDVPALTIPARLRETVDAVWALEAALDEACATAEAPAGADTLAAADEDAAAAREELLSALLDLAADATVAAEALRRATDKLEQHGEFRSRFPAPMQAKFNKRMQEAWQALHELGESLCWLTRAEGDEARG